MEIVNLKSNSHIELNLSGSSYAGNPKDNTFMYISHKVEYLVQELYKCKNCLIFIEKGISVPEKIQSENKIVFTDLPQYEYAVYATEFENNLNEKKRLREYKIVNGSHIGENVSIGINSYIEPGCFIDHDVCIGNNATILSGSRIRNAIIGNNFLCNENAVIGNNSFTIAEDTLGNRLRIPALGNVVIENNVEVGACDNIARGTCGSTILEDNVKLDALVHIGHEAHISKNTEITAGATIGGFVVMGEQSFVGVGAQIKNRLDVGKGSVIGMGATVIRNIDKEITVIGNPAKPLKR